MHIRIDPVALNFHWLVENEFVAEGRNIVNKDGMPVIN